ncbi:Glu/Leu/Phe/Val dehydrogenase [Candidatus Woesearchaeota archaeon]|nr:Glu/Leu/Phe/Val dehydrogenase [Candidatus Woesearchaeota archaeon]
MDGVRNLELHVPGVTSFELWNGSRYIPGFIATTSDVSSDLPALGGCRVSDKYFAITGARADAERLAKGMQLKSALAELPISGGKTVLYANLSEKTEALLISFAEVLNALEGQYITAEDSGTNSSDMNFLAQYTPYVVGTDGTREWNSGNPSPITAYGVYEGILAGLEFLGLDKEERKYFIKGGGGSVACSLLFGFPQDEKFDPFRSLFPGLLQDADKVYFSEINNLKADEVRKEASRRGLEGKLICVGLADLSIRYDVFVPAALGGSISHETLQLRRSGQCRLIAGPENNQLEKWYREEPDPAIHHILYAPDFAINAGGIINVYAELVARQQKKPYVLEEALNKTRLIKGRLHEILQEARERNKPTNLIATERAEKIIQQRLVA